MSILEKYQAVIEAVPNVAGGVAQARRQIEQGLKNTGVGPSAGEADKAAGSWGRLTKSVAGFPGALKQFYHTGGIGQAVDGLKEARRATNELGSSLRDFVPAIAGLTALGSVAGLGEGLRGFAEYGVTLRNVSAPLGVATQDLERWSLAGERAGVATGAVATAFGNLNQKLMGAATGTDVGAVGLFNWFHIATRNADGSVRDLMQVLPEVFAAFKANRDPRIQNYLLNAFGLGDLDPLFRRARDYGELLDELHKKEPLTADQIARAHKLFDSYTGLTQSVRLFGYALSADLAPTFGPLLTDMAGWLDKNRENKEAMGQVKLGAEVLAGALGVTLVSSLTSVLWLANKIWAAPFFRFLASAAGMRLLGVLGPIGAFAATMRPGSAGAGENEAIKAHPELYPQGQSIDPDRLTPQQADQVLKNGYNLPADLRRRLEQRSRGGSGAAAGSSQAIPQSYNPAAGNSEAMIRAAVASAGGNAMAQAGLLSNFQAESRLDPTARNPNSSATGWAQWISSTRPRPLSSFGDPLDPGTQAKMLQWELSGPYHSVIDRMNAAKTPEEAAEIGLRRYEGINEGNSDLAGAPWPRMLATHIAKARGYFAGGAADPGAAQPDFAAASAANSRHEVEVHFVNAPAGMRSGLRAANGPADFGLRVDHAMATP